MQLAAGVGRVVYLPSVPLLQGRHHQRSVRTWAPAGQFASPLGETWAHCHIFNLKSFQKQRRLLPAPAKGHAAKV